ncbi:aldo/keto reductase family protein [Butyrivibrio sp. XPD2006]|uniref:aldo/keto reductase family protein n=1 Tax=Butyrivibrio sp. XPD2006 TaxID=1280668 RepID=UPI00040880D8|nr:aldo/keto reductase [Butyrivibrio sp. XPD2006]
MSEFITNVPTYTLNTGAVMPAVGLGTFGSDKYTPDQIANAVSGAIKAGYRMLDCASVYQNEEQIGGVLNGLFREGIVKREELFITSKVWNDRHREVRKACEKSLKDLGLDYIDLYFVHWPFPNYHAPGCDGDSRNPDSKPFSVDEFMDTWRQMEELYDDGLVKAIGMSNMTIAKLEKVLPLCRIKPSALEMECHPSFQQQELFGYANAHGIVPIGFCPIGSPSRPERDRCSTDVADTELPEVVSVAKNHDVHPAVICIKWAVQRGMCTIPFSVKEPQYISNLKCTTEDPLSDEEMELLKAAERGCRLVKGQVFLWPGATEWTQLWE